jgi:hypothetical protein
VIVFGGLSLVFSLAYLNDNGGPIAWWLAWLFMGLTMIAFLFAQSDIAWVGAGMACVSFAFLSAA